MKIELLNINGIVLADIISEEIVISNVQDSLDILANCDYHGSSRIIIKKECITPAFFDLKTGIAGDILQKFSNYDKFLAIYGDFSEIKSKSLKDLIYESNINGRVNFLGSKEEAIDKLSK